MNSAFLHRMPVLEPTTARRTTAIRTDVIRPLVPAAMFPLDGHAYGMYEGGIIDPTFTRATVATETHNGKIYPVASGDPRFQADSNPLGILIEGARTNYFLNSGTPATHTSGSLGTGDYTIWIPDGTSLQVAANTATGTGFGTATPGSPVTFNLTGAGTVDFTIVGSPSYAQCENGTFPSSYIETAGSSVTRNADSLSYALGSWFNTTEGTIVVEVNVPYVDGVDARLFILSDGSGNNRIDCYRQGGTAQALYIADGGVAQANIAVGSKWSDGQTSKVAIAWGNNDFIMYFDGAVLGTPDISGTVPTGLTTLNIGTYFNGNNPNYANQKNFQYYTSRLPNADLARLST